MSMKQPLAIVGVGCRFPGGVTDAQSYWRLLINGGSGITEIPADRWNWRKYFHLNHEVPGRMVTKWGGFIRDHDRFDAQFFGISPREAQRMDPQQRWLLETSWDALEDAGLPPSSLRGSRTSVFVGISSHDYVDIQRGDTSLLDIHSGTGNALSIAANRISYLFDFRGPSVAVDTACSSALVATYLACQRLWANTRVPKDAIAGAVITTQRGTLVPLDAKGQPLRPFIVWMDQRRAQQTHRLAWWWESAFKLIGMRDTIEHFQREAEANWIAQNEPEVWKRTDKFLLLSGYLHHRFTGKFVDSVANQVGYIPFEYKSS